MSQLASESLPRGRGRSRRDVAYLALLAMGVIYGDIGTSPLYAIRECFHGESAVAISHDNVLGVLSLVFWTIVLLVAIKYHIYVIRADHRGEGGILALTTLVHKAIGQKRAWVVLLPLGLFGAALLYGDGALTPAISVLSAVEGLKIATPVFAPYVVPITVVILVVLFALQHHGTGGVGRIFGPITLVWFLSIATSGVASIVQEPSVLGAVNPMHAVHFLTHNGAAGFLVLGAVFLVATGGEALYADLGHFGHRAIQIDWFAIVGPALLMNYFGQGALLLREPAAAENPFYHLVPDWGLYPMVALATGATVIASQAIITGVFSLTRQAAQLGYLPRVRTIHTSSKEIGQVYLPGMNWLLMIGTIGLVIGFGSSSALASAYGVAISTTMVITTVLAFPVAWRVWGWPLPVAMGVTAVFLIIDLAFFGANIVKVAQGGWLPLLAAGAIYLLMITWKRGRALISERIRQQLMPRADFIANLAKEPVHRVPGTAVFMTGNPQAVPLALVHNLQHNKTLHERVVFLTVIFQDVPRVPSESRIELADLGDGFHEIVARYGFMEEPDVPAVLEGCAEKGLTFNLLQATFFLGRETLLPSSRRGGMARWRKRLFVGLSRNSQPPPAYFQIPPNRVIEVGAQIEF